MTAIVSETKMTGSLASFMSCYNVTNRTVGLFSKKTAGVLQNILLR